jgi:hypothetical protein
MNLEQIGVVDCQSPIGCDPTKAKSVAAAIEENILNEDNPLLMIYNLTLFRYIFKSR